MERQSVRGKSLFIRIPDAFFEDTDKIREKILKRDPSAHLIGAGHEIPLKGGLSRGMQFGRIIFRRFEKFLPAEGQSCLIDQDCQLFQPHPGEEGKLHQ